MTTAVGADGAVLSWPSHEHTLTILTTCGFIRGITFIGQAFEVVFGRCRAVLDVRGADFAMMQSEVMLGKIISLVVLTGFSINAKLPLPHPVLDPIELHVHGFGTLLFDVFGGDSNGSCVVRLHRCRRLRMS